MPLPVSSSGTPQMSMTCFIDIWGLIRWKTSIVLAVGGIRCASACLVLRHSIARQNVTINKMRFMSLTRHSRINGRRLTFGLMRPANQSTFTARIKLRRTLPPLASNELYYCAIMPLSLFPLTRWRESKHSPPDLSVFHARLLFSQRRVRADRSLHVGGPSRLHIQLTISSLVGSVS